MKDEKNVFLRDEFIGSIFVDENYHKNHPHYLHLHKNMLELLYITEGNGMYYVDNSEYVVREGNLVICNAGVTHGEIPHRNNSMKSYCCQFTGVKVKSLPENTLFTGNHNPVLYFQGEATGKIMSALYEMSGVKNKNIRICQSLADALLNITYDSFCERRNIVTYNKKNNEEFILEILRYLDENFAEPITLKDISAKFSISESQLSHFFKEEVGISPKKYIIYKRIGEAQSLLENKKIPLDEIGSKTGFLDSSHFSSTFRKNVGITPSQYRAKTYLFRTLKKD